MKQITLLLFFTLAILSNQAQTLEWISSGAGNAVYSNQDIGYSVASNNNFVIISGFVAGNSVKIQDTTINHGNFSFIAKYDKTGDLKWIRENDGEGITDVSINSKGEIYSVYSTWNFENHILKFDENGNELWDKVVTNIDKINSLTIDKDDNLILTGRYSANASSHVIEDTVIYDLIRDRVNGFIMKFNANGEFEWFNTTRLISNNGGYISFYDVKADNNGDIVVFGDYELWLEEDYIKLGEYNLNSESNPIYDPSYFSHKDIVLVKLNSQGNFVWANKFGGYSDDLGARIAVNNTNEIFIVGNFVDSISLGDFHLKDFGIGMYLSKIDATGEIVWANKISSNTTNSSLEVVRTIAVDKKNVFVGGSYDGSWIAFGSKNLEDSVINHGANVRTGFLAKYSLEGDFISLNNLLTVNNLNIESAKIEDIHITNEQVYLTGNFYPPSTFFNQSVPTVFSNTNHFFIASLNTTSLTGLPQIQNNHLTFYPNPVKDYININLENVEIQGIISIFDIKGNIHISLKSAEIADRIDVSSLKNGLYFMSVSTNKGLYFGKFIKED